jgi:dienelactone hydrolase
VLFDQCGYGASFCEKDSATEPEDWITSTKAAVAWARAHGARRITLVGASAGGIVVLHAAASIQPPIDAVVDLSGELTWSGLDALTAARIMTVSVLYAVAPHDDYVTVADMRQIYAATGSRTKRLVQAQSGHGWEMLTTPSRTGWSPLAAQVAAIIRGTHR